MIWKPPLKIYINHSCETWKGEEKKEEENKVEHIAGIGFQG